MEPSTPSIKKLKSIGELLRFSLINIDKPTGPTSFTISDFIRKSLNLKKTSHFGTLDPNTSGVLPIALSHACRLNEYFAHRDKIYVGIMRIHKDIEQEELEKNMKKFTGKILQLPPVRSRVKRALREREVKSFKILEKEGKDVLFIAEVEAGTYIRKLCDDLGKLIGGAHMLELRRTKASIFTEEDSINLYQLEEAAEEYKKGKAEKLRSILIPAESCILKVMPEIQIKSSSLKQIIIGKPLMKGDITNNLPQDETFAIFHNNTFIGIYKKSNEKDIIARPEFVFN